MGNINKRITGIRTALNKKQGEFASDLGYKQTRLSMIENEHNPVPNDLVNLICLTFNINENWLRTGEGEMFNTKKSQIDESKLNELEEDLLNTFRGLEEPTQNHLLEQAHSLLRVQRALKGEDDKSKQPAPADRQKLA